MSSVAGLLSSNLAPFGHGCHKVVDPGPGLYAMWLRGQCLYVGMSEYLRRRISQHETAEDNQDLADYYRQFPGEIQVSVVHVDAGAARLRQLESEVINKLRPAANSRGSGGACG